jgi:hypothetical protein
VQGQKFDYQVIRRKFGNYLQNGFDSIGGGGTPSPPLPLSRSPEQEIELSLGLEEEVPWLGEGVRTVTTIRTWEVLVPYKVHVT